MKNKEKIQRRKIRTRSKITGSKSRPRLSVFRSSKHIYAQLINDELGQTLIQVDDKLLETKGMNKTEKSKKVGVLIAKKAKEKKISRVIFDRGSYQYHGRVRALADGAREGGLNF